MFIFRFKVNNEQKLKYSLKNILTSFVEWVKTKQITCMFKFSPGKQELK